MEGEGLGILQRHVIMHAFSLQPLMYMYETDLVFCATATKMGRQAPAESCMECMSHDSKGVLSEIHENGQQ